VAEAWAKVQSVLKGSTIQMKPGGRQPALLLHQEDVKHCLLLGQPKWETCGQWCAALSDVSQEVTCPLPLCAGTRLGVHSKCTNTTDGSDLPALDPKNMTGG
jgi:hypothetical protein